MSIFQAIILGIVQGLTEFLPVSSSGHLVLIPYFLGWTFPTDQIFPFNVLVQLGTLLAVIIYFRKDLWRIIKAVVLGLVHRKPFKEFDARLGWLLILATLPAVVIGLLIKNLVESAFQSPLWVAGFLLLTALFLVIAEVVGKRKRTLKKVDWKDALWVGGWQVVSLFPGISRSGATITGGMTRNLDRPSAARFSFLMSVPVMIGAGLVSVFDLVKVQHLSQFLLPLGIGFILAAIVGFFSIHFLMRLISKHSFFPFAIYCALLGLFTFGFTFFRAPSVPATSLSSIPTPQTVNVVLSPSLGWLGNTFSQCARLQPDLAVIIDENSADQMLPLTEPSFRWGDPGNLPGFVYPLGTDNLVVIVNPANTFTSIDQANIQGIFSGVTTKWPDPDQTAIKVWEYLPGEDIQQLFENVILKGGQITSLAFIAGDPQQMRSAVAADPGAIGFIPSRWLDSTVRSLSITNIDPSTLSFPVLALTPAEPSGVLRTWLACLQEFLNP
jgi:undecaprenyl-diphosphatase